MADPSAHAPGLKLTPMLEQYLRIKAEHPDALLLFHLGDFYELFFEDAERAARLLDITLTTRSRKDDVPIPMCGVPHHAVQPYVAKLLAAGQKVALCDQVEDPSSAKGIVRRALVRVITPGTVTEEAYLDPKQPNYLAVVLAADAGAAVVCADLSTGEVLHARPADEPALIEALSRFSPREVLIVADADALATVVVATLPDVTISRAPAARFDGDAGNAWLQAAGSVTDGARWPDAIAAACGALLWYLGETHRSSVTHLRAPGAADATAAVLLDEATRRHLELLATTRGERKGSVLWVIDQTATPMGSRLLRQWLLAPLTDVAAIGARLDAVEELVRMPARRAAAAPVLSAIGDLERLGARLAAARVTARDLLGLGTMLAAVERLRAAITGSSAAGLQQCAADLDDLPAVRARIAATLNDEVALSPTPGTIIRPGFDAHVDELRDLAHRSKRFISELETRERSRTGIASLKVRYNQVFGYAIEVTKPNLHLVPSDYRRKQTLANAERFVTAELEEYEAKVLGAEERLAALEATLLNDLIAAVAAMHAALARTAAAVARLDVFAGLAVVAERHGYVRPQLTRERRLVIVEGRHPVVERMAGRHGFVANDCLLDRDAEQIIIVTGPNMAGKSTYLRQVALIVLLAQMGSFVPAASADIGVLDRVFTRIGASDNLAGGESTFMVEMKETANIVRQLTDRSLVVLDEIGRGTSTFDGISIAWAVAEHLHDHAAQRPLVLFATHYHELTDLARTKTRVRNCSVAVREWKGEVLFLRRIVPGPASQSYGIEVARLAGLPDTVIARAREILANLERGELTDAGVPRLAQTSRPDAAEQLGLFAAAEHQLTAELAALDVDRMAPLEALTRLHQLAERARKR